jgi:hypothetical protein
MVISSIMWRNTRFSRSLLPRGSLHAESTLQATLRERFGFHVSVSQFNRVQAALGESNHFKRSPQEKNDRIRSFFVTP